MTCVRHSCLYSYQVLFPSLLCSSFFISTHYSISTRRIKRIVWSNVTLNRSSRTGLSVLHFPTQCTNLKLFTQDTLCMLVLGSTSCLARERTCQILASLLSLRQIIGRAISKTTSPQSTIVMFPAENSPFDERGPDVMEGNEGSGDLAGDACRADGSFLAPAFGSYWPLAACLIG